MGFICYILTIKLELVEFATIIYSFLISVILSRDCHGRQEAPWVFKKPQRKSQESCFWDATDAPSTTICVACMYLVSGCIVPKRVCLVLNSFYLNLYLDEYAIYVFLFCFNFSSGHSHVDKDFALLVMCCHPVVAYWHPKLTTHC